jgi:hypothetical protein
MQQHRSGNSCEVCLIQNEGLVGKKAICGLSLHRRQRAARHYCKLNGDDEGLFQSESSNARSSMTIHT